MKAYFYASSLVTSTNSAVRYGPVETARVVWNATEANVNQPIPHDLTVDRLQITIGTAPGAGKSYTFVLMQNGNPTSLSVTIADSATSGSDNSNSVSLTAGDKVSIRCTPSGTPATFSQCSWIIRQTATGKFAVLTGSNGTALSAATGTIYLSPHANNGNITTEADFNVPSPLGGTIKNLYVVTSANVTNTWTISTRKDAGASGPSVILTGAVSSGNDITNTTAIVADNLICFECAPTSTPATVSFGLGYTVEVTNDGESWLLHSIASSNGPSNSATNYAEPISGLWNATEALKQIQAGQATYKAIYIKLRTAPGAGKNRSFTLNKAGVGTALTATVSDTATTANLTGQSVSLADGDLISLATVPSGTPASTATKIGLLISQPTGDTVTPNHLASTTTIHSPTIATGGVTVTPNPIAATTTLHSPTATSGAVTIVPNALAASTQFYQPTVTSVGTVVPDHLAPGTTIYAPIVTFGYTITPNALASSTQFYAPVITTGSVTVIPNHLASTTTVYTLSLDAFRPYRLLPNTHRRLGPRSTGTLRRRTLGTRGVLRGPRKYR